MVDGELIAWSGTDLLAVSESSAAQGVSPRQNSVMGTGSAVSEPPQERVSFAVLEEPTDRRSAQTACAAVLELLRPVAGQVLVEVWSDFRLTLPPDVRRAQATLRLPGGGAGWREPGDVIVQMRLTPENWAALALYAGWSRQVRIIGADGSELAQMRDAGSSIRLSLLPAHLPALRAAIEPLSVVPLTEAVAAELERRQVAHVQRRAAEQEQLRQQSATFHASRVPGTTPPPEPLPGAERAGSAWWQVTVSAHVEANSAAGAAGGEGDSGVGVLPLIEVWISGSTSGRWVFGPPPVSARWQEGHAFVIELRFEDPIAPGPGEDLHPSRRRQREKQRTVFSTFLDVQREHVTADGLDVRLDDGWQPELGWVVPAPPPGVAVMGDLRPFVGWHVSLLRGASGSFEVRAPAWWGRADRSPEGFAPGDAGLADPADGVLTLTVTLEPS